MSVLNRLALLASILGSAALAPLPAHAQTLITDPATCARRAFAEPAQTLTLARAWEEAGGGNAARHCAALALMAGGEYRQAGDLLAALAAEMAADPALANAPQPAADDAPTRERVRVHAQAAQAFQAAEETDKALAQIDAALALAGRNVDLLLDRAVIAGGAGRYPEALETLDRAAAIAPKRVEIWLYRAGALRALGLPGEAAIEIEQALQLKPKDPAALLERGAIRRATGNLAGARADWQAVRQLDPGGPLAAEAEANLGMLRGQ